MKTLVALCSCALSISSVAQNVVQNPGSGINQTIAQKPGTELSVNRFEGIRFADQFSTVQLAISDLPSSGGTVFIPPGSYPGPTSIPSNVSLIALSAPANLDVVGSWTSLNNTMSQVTLTYSGNLVLTDVHNVYFKGISLDFQNKNFGLILTSSSYNRFEDVSIVNAGGPPPPEQAVGPPALMIDTSGTGASHNSFKNTFDNLNILCNQTSYCYAGILLEGTTGPPPSAVTLNTFISVVISGAINMAIDMEAQTDTNHFYDVEVNQDLSSAPSASCVLCFNTTTPGTDIDADGSSFENIGITGPFANQVLGGVSSGNVISGNLTPSQIHPLSSKYPAFTLTTSPTGPGLVAQQMLFGGHLGLSGPEGDGRNLDIAGSCALSAGSCPANYFNYPYTYAPTCVVSWQAPGPTGVLYSNMTNTYIAPKSSVSSDSGVVEWHCFGNPY